MSAQRPRAIVDALVAKCAQVLTIEPAAVMATGREIAPAAARAACWQVLREGGWTLTEIAQAFNRTHGTVSTQERKSARRERVDADHAYLVTELRRIVRESTRPAYFESRQVRVRAQVWALDQELAAATALRDELVARITRVQRVRGQLAAIGADMAAEDVITRGASRQLKEAS